MCVYVCKNVHYAGFKGGGGGGGERTKETRRTKELARNNRDDGASGEHTLFLARQGEKYRGREREGGRCLKGENHMDGVHALTQHVLCRQCINYGPFARFFFGGV